MGFVFQSFNLVPSLTVELKVTLPARLARRRCRRQEIRDVLGAVGLTLAATIGARDPVTWFARAGVAVAGDDTVTVPSGEAGAGPQILRTAGARAVPAALAGPLSALGRGR